MSYYPVWFDYAVWVLVGFGALCGLMMLPEPTGPKRGKLKLLACILVALGIAFAGTAGLIFNLRAAHFDVQGTLTHVVVKHGGRSSSTLFQLIVPGQPTKSFEIGRDVPQILPGETMKVTYQADSNHVLGAQIVSGAYAGYDYADGDNSGGSIVVILVALALALYGVLNFLSDGTAEAVETDDRPVPSGADTESILDLSNRDSN